MHPGLWGGIAGGVIGVIGGAIGTYFSVKNAESSRERGFLIKAAILMWVGITGFVTLLLTLPSPYRWLLWVPYAILLPLTIVQMNKRLSHIRRGGSKL